MIISTILKKILLLNCLHVIFAHNKCSMQSGIFLQSFLKNQDINMHIISFLCYRPDELAHFFKCLESHIGFITFKRYEPVYISNNISSNVVLFVADFKCNYTINLLERMINARYFTFPYRWMLFNAELTNLPSLKFFADSNIYFITSLTNWEEAKIIQGYKINYYDPYILEEYGVWNINLNQLNITQISKVISRRRSNLRGKIFKSSLVITNNDSINHLVDGRDKHIDSITKVNYNFVRYLVECLNSTVIYNTVNTWGYHNSNTDSWSGMIGDLVNNQADIGGTASFFTSDRISVIEYISMTSQTNVKFVFREPPLSFVSNIFLLPFSIEVWITCIMLIIALTFMVLTSIYIQNEIEFQDQERNDKIVVTDYIVIGISSVCQMGSSIQPKILSARISFIFLLVALLFLYTSYTAYIVALLQSTTKSIQTLSDLLKSDLTIGIEDTPYNRYYFKEATQRIHKQIYQKKVSELSFMNISEGIARVRKGSFAFNVELGPGYRVMEETFYEHEKCNLMEIPFLSATDTWLAIKKLSYFKEMLKVNLFKIREHGLQQREMYRIYTKKPDCIVNGKSFQSVRLGECYGAVEILLIGFGTSITIWIIELLLKTIQLKTIRFGLIIENL